MTQRDQTCRENNEIEGMEQFRHSCERDREGTGKFFSKETLV